MPDGTYGAEVTCGADHAWSLDYGQAVAYATACVEQAAAADHGTAVMRLFTEVGIPADAAGECTRRSIGAMADGERDKATRPLRFVPSVGRARHPRPDAGRYLPVIEMKLDGKDIGVMSPQDLRDHAIGVLGALTAAKLDECVFQFLTECADLDGGTARAVVGSLSEHMPCADDSLSSGGGS
jgi:hypothetical protein